MWIKFRKPHPILEQRNVVGRRFTDLEKVTEINCRECLIESSHRAVQNNL